MTATFESLGFGGPEFDLDNDLPGALRAGLKNLRIAAAEHGMPETTLVAVFEAAFNPFCEFMAGHADDYNEVVEVSMAANGWAWTDACLIDLARRSAEFLTVHKQAVRYAAKHFPTLHVHDRAAVVDDLLYIELSGSWIYSTAFDADLPGWMIPGIVFDRLRWRLLDAKCQLVDRPRKIGGSVVQSLNQFVDDLGEREAFVRPMWDVPVDDASIEAVVWAVARANLADRAVEMIGAARAGATREKASLIVEAAKWVLTRGAEDSLNKGGGPACARAEEVRQTYAQDSLLVCFHGLRAAAPRTWGVYPATAVPTRDVIARVATETSARGNINSGWFACLEARRVEVAKSDRILHGVRRLVEALIEEAAHDSDS